MKTFITILSFSLLAGSCTTQSEVAEEISKNPYNPIILDIGEPSNEEECTCYDFFKLGKFSDFKTECSDNIIVKIEDMVECIKQQSQCCSDWITGEIITGECFDCLTKNNLCQNEWKNCQLDN